LQGIPDPRQPGDHGRLVRPYDQAEFVRELTESSLIDNGVLGIVAQILLAEANLAADLRDGFQRLVILNARQQDLHAAGVHDDLRAVVTPPRAHLRYVVHDGEDLDAQAADRGQPLVHRNRARLADLVQEIAQRPAEAAPAVLLRYERG